MAKEELTSRVAYAIWHDAAKRADALHSQKWAGMIIARLLKSIADDSRAIKRLTWVLVVLTVVVAILTGVLSAEVVMRWFHP